MKTFSSKSNARRALKAIGDAALASADSLLSQDSSGKWGFSIAEAELLQYEKVTGLEFNEETTQVEIPEEKPVPEEARLENEKRLEEKRIQEEEFHAKTSAQQAEVAKEHEVTTIGDGLIYHPLPKKTPKIVAERGKSTHEKPCMEVWNIAGVLFSADPKVTRKEILEACSLAGIAFYTARTQYQLWRQAQNASQPK